MCYWVNFVAPARDPLVKSMFQQHIWLLCQHFIGYLGVTYFDDIGWFGVVLQIPGNNNANTPRLLYILHGMMNDEGGHTFAEF